MGDSIDRKTAIETVRKCAVKEVTPAYMLIDRAEAMTELMMLPPAQPHHNPDEWCTDCAEYDSEKHCCPRFNQVIRQTLSEQTEVIRCKECINNRNCDIQYYAQAGDEFWCAAAERRTDE